MSMHDHIPKPSELPSSQQIIAAIDAAEPAHGTVALWWLGQHGFVLKAGATVVYIDVFFSDVPGRNVPPLVGPADVRHADLVLGTHDHADHIDRDAWPIVAGAVAGTAPGARFVVPAALLPELADDLGIAEDRFIGLDDGLSAEAAGVRITAIPAAHEGLDRDAETGRYPYLGFIIEAGGCVIYHAGDTCWYAGLRERLEPWRFDLMLLPINGRDGDRLANGIVGNMTFPEAADLAGPLVPGLVVPTHWDMFDFNPGDPDAFVRYMEVKYPGVPARILPYGQRVDVKSRDR